MPSLAFPAPAHGTSPPPAPRLTTSQTGLPASDSLPPTRISLTIPMATASTTAWKTSSAPTPAPSRGDSPPASERQHLHLHPPAERHPGQRPHCNLPLVHRSCHLSPRWPDGGGTTVNLTTQTNTPGGRHHHRHRHGHRHASRPSVCRYQGDGALNVHSPL